MWWKTIIDFVAGLWVLACIVIWFVIYAFSFDNPASNEGFTPVMIFLTTVLYALLLVSPSAGWFWYSFYKLKKAPPPAAGEQSQGFVRFVNVTLLIVAFFVLWHLWSVFNTSVLETPPAMYEVGE